MEASGFARSRRDEQRNKCHQGLPPRLTLRLSPMRDLDVGSSLELVAKAFDSTRFLFEHIDQNFPTVFCHSIRHSFTSWLSFNKVPPQTAWACRQRHPEVPSRCLQHFLIFGGRRPLQVADRQTSSFWVCRTLCGVARLELATPCVTGRYSNQLNSDLLFRDEPFRFLTTIGRGAKIARSFLSAQKKCGFRSKKFGPLRQVARQHRQNSLSHIDIHPIDAVGTTFVAEGLGPYG